MKTKKIVSLALSGALALSMSVPAFALTDLSEGAELEITGTTQVPKIEVVVPTTGSVILNPYAMAVTVDGAAKKDQIIGAIQAIENKSEIPIKVGGKITGTAEGATLVDSIADQTKKQVKLDFKIDKGTSATADPSGATAVTLKTTAQDITEVELDEAGGTNAFATFQLSGEATTNPSEVWSTGDTIGATIAFTFAPNAKAASSGSDNG